MKRMIILFVFISSGVMAQNSFEFSKKGLSPKETSINVSNTTSEKAFKKISSWIESNKEEKKLESTNSVENKSIEFNATQVDVRYSKTKSYYVKMYLKININDSGLVFTPFKIELKQNSKYDMGWKELDLNKPYTFFKNIKGNKKSFLNGLASSLNQLKADIEKSIN